ncbi:hypothetical protein [Brucella intermedia]|uniref:hypothetical protein n=1 Tax=Brucella intermedia TaxID=94625 RepID=UPI000DE4D681|nr:hypothetical protein [Brucella intermedia]MPR61284.1 hypothetical protein [Brucella intermedia]
MRGLFSIVFVSALFSCASANAQSACSTGKDPVVKLLSWEAKQVDGATTEFILNVETSFSKKVRMVDGFVSYSDTLGERMGAFVFPRDDSLPAKSKTIVTVKIGSKVVPRILNINKEDAVADLCINGVVYADGSKETFK